MLLFLSLGALRCAYSGAVMLRYDTVFSQYIQHAASEKKKQETAAFLQENGLPLLFFSALFFTSSSFCCLT
jgi:hypothetical protein